MGFPNQCVSDSPCASYLVQTTPYASDGATQNGPVSIVYLGALDREVGRDTQGFDGSTVRATKTYDALGRVSQTSRPYFANGGAVEPTTFNYDTLGRVVKVTAPDVTQRECQKFCVRGPCDGG